MMDQRDIMVFCTLFDSNYLDKGIALYESMKKNIGIFKLYIFTFDKTSFEIITAMHLKNVILISIENIMSTELLEIKNRRTRAEFCWTCTPIVIEYVLLNYKENICTYIDADIYFFSSPINIIREIIEHKCSVGLVEHRFEKNYEYGLHVFEVGRYCVQFNTFQNNKIGLQILCDWRENCFKWCYRRHEDGKFGDQKYLDKWKLKYDSVFENQDSGAGVAPWNLHLYTNVRKSNGNIWMDYKGEQVKLIFYHFEGMKYSTKNKVYLNLWNPGSRGTSKKIKIIYGEYFKNIESIRRYLAKNYGIIFQNMIADKNSFFGTYHLLSKLCIENGVIYGLYSWIAQLMNNVVKINRVCGKG